MNLREIQEPVLRWAATAAFAGCGTAFCVSLGDVTASSSFGLLFGAVFAGIPGALLWGRELNEATIRSERAQVSGRGSLPFRAEVDETEPAPQQTLRSVEQPTGNVRSTDYYDDEDD